ncbi:MAG: Hsp20/alpha crystallin family protein [Candidatus Anstonellales archaeon]
MKLTAPEASVLEGKEILLSITCLSNLGGDNMIDPFEELKRMEMEMQRMRRRFRGINFGMHTNADLIDNKDSYTVVFELPGFEKSEIEVNVSEGSISVKAEKKEQRGEQKKNYVYRERSASSMFRTIAFPEPVDPNSAVATYKNGILNVDIKKAIAKKRKVEIK